MKPTVTTDQIKRFQADGVVFLEGFFPQEYIDSLSTGIKKFGGSTKKTGME